jgi:branched-chain amino acid transport system permease protein
VTPAFLRRTADAFREGAHDARRGWGTGATAVAAVAAVAALVPAIAPSGIRIEGLAGTLYLALAAVGLAFCVGLAGMPSLAQGAFVATGAAGAALARAHWDAPPLAAALLGAAVAAAGGLAIGVALARLRPAFVAVSTWIVAWIAALALVEFPELSGGAQGLVVPDSDVAGLAQTATFHYELALALLVLAAIAFRVFSRGRDGNALGALRQRPAAASALGVPAVRLRATAFAISAAIGGLAGGLSVQLAGISDPAAYTPFLSFTLFVAVLVGGARTATGAIAGVLFVELIFYGANRIASLGGLATGRLDALVGAMVLLYVLGLDSEGLLPAALERVPWIGRARRAVTPGPEPAAAGPPPLLVAEALEKRFGDVAAVRGLDLELAGGTITALIGPNGSGKTTALRLLSGTLSPDSGRITLDGRSLDAGARERALAGVVRTLQPTSVFGELTALGNVLVGAGLRSRDGGFLRTVFATPRARRDAGQREGRALAALEEVGLAGAAGVRASELPGSEQRLLMLASALAAGPRVLLVDEPSAGASPLEVLRLAGVLDALRGRGLALLVVEHNLRLVRRIADRVIVMESGRPIAAGPPDEVAADPAVQGAYLGRRTL